MLRIAFKEWAAVCRALASGRQSLIIRKGGIAEAGGVFAPCVLVNLGVALRVLRPVMHDLIPSKLDATV